MRRFSFEILSEGSCRVIVHFSGGKTPNLLPYWTGQFTLLLTELTVLLSILWTADMWRCGGLQ